MKRWIFLTAVCAVLFSGCRKETKYERYLRVLREDLVLTTKEFSIIKAEHDGMKDGTDKRSLATKMRDRQRKLAQLRTKIDRLNSLVSARKGVSGEGKLTDLLINQSAARERKMAEYRTEQVNRAWRQGGYNPPGEKGSGPKIEEPPPPEEDPLAAVPN